MFGVFFCSLNVSFFFFFIFFFLSNDQAANGRHTEKKYTKFIR